MIERLLSHFKPPKIASAPYNAIIKIAKKGILQPYTVTRVSATTPISGLPIFKPA